MNNRKFILDSNIFIQAKRLYYPFNFCEGFWDWLKIINGENNIISIDKVYHELQHADYPDDLSDWAKKNKKLFAEFDGKSIPALKQIRYLLEINKVNENYIRDFLETDIADPFLIAYAKTHDLVLITHERKATNSTFCSGKKIKMPDVCDALGVKCIQIFDLMRKTNNHKLVLK